MINIKDLFVSYEIAKKLKDKGFNEPCFSYFGDGRLEIKDNRRASIYNYSSDIFDEEELKEPFLIVLAPLYQQVVDWFREEHNILIFPFIQLEHLDENYKEKTVLEYIFFIFDLKEMIENETNVLPYIGEGTDDFYVKNRENPKDIYQSPQEASLAAIEKAIKLIDKKEFKKGGDIESKKNKETMSNKNEIFEEIADYGDQMYFTRDFGHVIIDEEDKEIPLVLVAEISDYYEATGEDEFKEKPFVISIDIYPRIDFIDKAHIDSCAHSCGIQPEEVGYTDLKSYGLGIPLLLKDLEEPFGEMSEAEEFIKSDDLMKKLNAKSMLIGFFMDGAINRAGNSRWSYLEYALDKKKSFY